MQEAGQFKYQETRAIALHIELQPHVCVKLFGWFHMGINYEIAHEDRVFARFRFLRKRLRDFLLSLSAPPIILDREGSPNVVVETSIFRSLALSHFDLFPGR